jgi:hypothetical protein
MSWDMLIVAFWFGFVTGSLAFTVFIYYAMFARERLK